MLGRKEKKRWQQLGELFLQLGDDLEPFLLELSKVEEEIPELAETGPAPLPEPEPVSSDTEPEEQLAEAAVLATPEDPEVEKPVQAAPSEEPEEVKSSSLPELSLELPASLFFSSLDWQKGERVQELRVAPPSRSQQLALPAQLFFQGLPWDGRRDAAADDRTAMARMMAVATRQALGSARSAGFRYGGRDSARNFFSSLDWDNQNRKASNQ